MKRHISGLSRASASGTEKSSSGRHLVRVERVQYRWHAQKPFYAFVFTVLQPQAQAGNCLNARLYCTPKTLWKLRWFLEDFGYDRELLGRDDIDEEKLIGLTGVVNMTYSIAHGTSLPSLDAFAPKSHWGNLSVEPHDLRSRESQS
jgi:hypothetical protein